VMENHAAALRFVAGYSKSLGAHGLCQDTSCLCARYLVHSLTHARQRAISVRLLPLII
jgi:hypothetical protein